MEELERIINKIDEMIEAWEIGVTTIPEHFHITRSVAEPLTESFVNDLKRIKGMLLQEG